MVSFLLPTARSKSHLHVVQECINSIYKYHEGVIDYEILIAADSELSGNKIKCFLEKEPCGPLKACNFLANQASSEYLVCLSDDHRFTSPIIPTIDMLEGPDYVEEFKITTLFSSISMIPNQGSRMGDRIIQEVLPSVQTLKFPVLKTSALNSSLKGKIFPTALTYHAADIWLSYFMAINDQPVRSGPTMLSPIAELKNATWEVEDCNKVYDMILKHLNHGYKEYF